jgi:S-adenosylmethionine:tRNA ribosyltransferase-isomerase
MHRMSEIDLYNFQLPEERIAQHPLNERVDARLLVVDRQKQSWETHHIRDLPELLTDRDMLVMNDTKVIPARLVGYRKRTGGKWTGLFLEAEENGFWRLLGKTRGRLEEGESVVLVNRSNQDVVELTLIQRLGGGSWLAKPSLSTSHWDLLEQVGRVPLPPYIRGGEMVDADLERYQTVYADRPGAVAAPTAGLHFTTPLLRSLENRGVSTQRVTLHVGEGTFRPITAEDLADHEMHLEWGELTEQVARSVTQHRITGGRLVAVGTTSVRVLESAAAAQRVAQLSAWDGETNLFIRPPYDFQVVDAILTNFHLPRSTLMVLVCTFGGRELILDAYQYAIAEKFRFYSYGDAMLIV